MKNLVKGVIRKAAHAAIEKTTPMDTNIAEITPYTFRKIDFPEKRINLLVPSINPEHVFGGISTALKFFGELGEKTGYAMRMILVDAALPRRQRRISAMCTLLWIWQKTLWKESRL